MFPSFLSWTFYKDLTELITEAIQVCGFLIQNILSINFISVIRLYTLSSMCFGNLWFQQKFYILSVLKFYVHRNLHSIPLIITLISWGSVVISLLSLLILVLFFFSLFLHIILSTVISIVLIFLKTNFVLLILSIVFVFILNQKYFFGFILIFISFLLLALG